MYRAVGNRCAVDISEWGFSVSEEDAISILHGLGFHPLDVSLEPIAKSVLGRKFNKLARMSEAPETFSCSGLIKWLYGQMGIWVPKRATQQFNHGTPVHPNDISEGDVIFATSFYPFDGVGHAAMATGLGTIIHATSQTEVPGVVEAPLAILTEADDFRGIRRFVANFERVIVLQTPNELEVETSDDIKWWLCRYLT